MRRVFRHFGRNRGYTVAAVFSIALAVGANAAIFSIVNALWLRPLPVTNPDRLVVPYRPVVHSPDGEVLDYFLARNMAGLHTLDAVDAVAFELHTRGPMAIWEPQVRLRDAERLLSAAIVSHTYFETLGVAVRGRGLTKADEVAGVETAGVVSDAFWRTGLRSDPAAIGRTLETTSGPIRIVGIAPPGFRGARLGETRELWLSLAGLSNYTDPGRGPMVDRIMPVTAYARLRSGVSVEAAEAQFRTILDRRTTLRSLRALTFPLRATGDLHNHAAVVRVLWAAALLVLLLGCATLAALVVARTEARQHEFAVRRCLGASPRRLTREAAAEAVILCVLGFAGGLIVRHWLVTAIGEFQVPAGVTIASLDAELDWRVTSFGAAVALLATTIAAGGAFLTTRRADLSRLMAASATTGTRQTVRLRQGLLAAHIALCTALLGCGIALTSNVRWAMRADLGYESDHLLFASLRPRLSKYETGSSGDFQARLTADLAALLQGLRELPNVQAAGYGAPIFDTRVAAFEAGLRAEGRPVNVPVAVRRVGPRYLGAVGARLLAGRDLDETDEGQSVDPMDVVRRQAEAASSGARYVPPRKRPAAVIDTSLASALWPGEPAVGRTFTLGRTGVPYTVVGVMTPVRYNTAGVPLASMYEVQSLSAVEPFRPLNFVIRTIGDARRERAAALAVFRRVFPDALQVSVRDASALIAEERARERMGAMVFSWFGVAAAILGLSGTYGLVAYLVMRQKRELGIRAALGAGQHQLLMLTAVRAVTPAVLGGAAGILLAAWVSKGLSAIVAGVSTVGMWPPVLSAFALVIAAVATAAAAARGIRHLRAADLLRAQ